MGHGQQRWVGWDLGIFSSLNGSMVLCLVHPAAGEMGSRNLMQLNQEWCRTPGQEQHSTAPVVCKAQVCLLLSEGGWGSAELKEPDSSSEKLGAGIAASKDGWKRHVLQETFSFPYPLSKAGVNPHALFAELESSAIS